MCRRHFPAWLPLVLTTPTTHPLPTPSRSETDLWAYEPYEGGEGRGGK